MELFLSYFQKKFIIHVIYLIILVMVSHVLLFGIIYEFIDFQNKTTNITTTTTAITNGNCTIYPTSHIINTFSYENLQDFMICVAKQTNSQIIFGTGNNTNNIYEYTARFIIQQPNSNIELENIPFNKVDCYRLENLLLIITMFIILNLCKILIQARNSIFNTRYKYVFIGINNCIVLFE
jgi:hypothetical protein